MKKNIGFVDRVIRLLAAAVVAVMYFMNQLSGIAAVILGLMAVVFILTSLVGSCPLYVPLKLSTRKHHD